MLDERNNSLTVSDENGGLEIKTAPQSHTPGYEVLERSYAESVRLVDDVIMKNYLTKLDEFEIVPFPKELNNISDIRLFKITEMVYQKNEYSTYKLASVFSAVQNLNCGVFIMMDSNGKKTDFYMGVRAFDKAHTPKSLKDTLKNALIGQFPGVKTEDLLNTEAEKLISKTPKGGIASVSCVAHNKDDHFTDNEKYIQGLEKFALAMQGQAYTAVILAAGISQEQFSDLRRAYETISTNLSPFANMQVSYGTNTAYNISRAFTVGSSDSVSESHTEGTSDSVSHTEGYSHSTTESKSVSKKSMLGNIVKTVGTAVVGAVAAATAPLTGGLSLVAGSALALGLRAYDPKTTTKSVSDTDTYNNSDATTHSTNESDTTGKTHTDNQSTTDTQGTTAGQSDNLQLTLQNKTISGIIERIDRQLKRLDECESSGMWECAAYFLANNQETVEMAAGTYKALMKGERSGIETSAINVWSRNQSAQLPVLREYITHFVHPVFAYNAQMSVSAASLVSSNELAVQMGLPRQSVCGFPVIEHAEFGKEPVTYSRSKSGRTFPLGKVFSMGEESDTDVYVDVDSLTMHTFITGSTGSGKSNTVYTILDQLRLQPIPVPFLVVEPAKGEYKNVFGNLPDVMVYGTNPKKSELLRLNPFRFPSDIHVLEHLDRLIEIFNVCWPMYAAMPAILKDAAERAYVAAGWNLSTSQNPKGNKFPNFADLLKQIEAVLNESAYSADSKGDYTGALVTRVRSLTTGLNSLIFCNDDLSDEELFDSSVIVDLSRVGSAETKSLIMGLLIMKLNEYRMCSGKINSPLSHITVLEEAHNLLKRTSTEQSSEGANLLGKSVEMLANSIAEMRTYGEGFIIADQSPGLLDMSVIRNTNTKIILRLPDKSDRELVGFAASLNEDQIDELSKLRRGVAAVYQNDWIQSVLVQVSKCRIEESVYKYDGESSAVNTAEVRRQLFEFLLRSRLKNPDFDIDLLRKKLVSLGLSTDNTDFVEEEIEDYLEGIDKSGAAEKEDFSLLASKITELAGARAAVERLIRTATDISELNRGLMALARQTVPDCSDSVAVALSHCFAKDMSCRREEAGMRDCIYRGWIDHVRGKEKGVDG